MESEGPERTLLAAPQRHNWAGTGDSTTLRTSEKSSEDTSGRPAGASGNHPMTPQPGAAPERRTCPAFWRCARAAGVRGPGEPPDVVLVESSGRDYPHGAGLALHLGRGLKCRPSASPTGRCWPPDPSRPTRPGHGRSSDSVGRPSRCICAPRRHPPRHRPHGVEHLSGRCAPGRAHRDCRGAHPGTSARPGALPARCALRRRRASPGAERKPPESTGITTAVQRRSGSPAVGRQASCRPRHTYPRRRVGAGGTPVNAVIRVTAVTAVNAHQLLPGNTDSQMDILPRWSPLGDRTG